MTLKCKLYGHEWSYRRTLGYRHCLRCGDIEEYDVNEEHTDEDAEKGERRVTIEEEDSGYVFKIE